MLRGQRRGSGRCLCRRGCAMSEALVSRVKGSKCISCPSLLIGEGVKGSDGVSPCKTALPLLLIFFHQFSKNTFTPSQGPSLLGFLAFDPFTTPSHPFTIGALVPVEWSQHRHIDLPLVAGPFVDHLNGAWVLAFETTQICGNRVGPSSKAVNCALVLASQFILQLQGGPLPYPVHLASDQLQQCLFR